LGGSPLSCSDQLNDQHEIHGGKHDFIIGIVDANALTLMHPDNRRLHFSPGLCRERRAKPHDRGEPLHDRLSPDMSRQPMNQEPAGPVTHRTACR
jgi:hypothetical protein